MSITITAGILGVLDGEIVLDTRESTGAPQVNLTNRNATTVLDLLGITSHPEWGYCGETEAGDMLGRILIAEALTDTAVDDRQGTPDAVCGNHHHYGRRPGYVAGTLARLREVAEWAAERGAVVVWS